MARLYAPLDDLADYADYCGPAVVASVLGVARIEAARRLASIRQPENGWGTHPFDVACLLGRRVVVTETADRARPMSGTECVGVRTYVKKRPTLARWLCENPEEEAVVMAADHLIHVEGGRVVEDNGIPRGRHHARLYIPITVDRARDESLWSGLWGAG